ASFLLWGQRQRHTNTDMGCSDSQSADNGSVEKHQEALCILASCYHGTAYAYVLRRFYRIYGKSRKTWNDFLAKEMQKAPPEPSLFD
ncbi:hypothetical protein, partial [Hallella sp.]|uniref:hypothetical protein n=1 Tax=Hallella sp. TaxID=2980186 RepID=UPI00307EDF7A